MRRMGWMWIATMLGAVALGAAAGCGGSSGGSTSSGVPTVLTDFQPASVVIGQPDFTSAALNQGGMVGPNTLAETYGCASDGTSLWIADLNNHRVLRYSMIPTTNDAAADLVLGQVGFTTSSSGTSASTLSYPHGICVSGGRLFVTEWGNRRVLIWNALPTVNGQEADVVVGQADFTSVVNTTTQVGGGRVQEVCVAGSRLVVSDTDNHRLLVWNSIPAANGTPADLVLGQADFTSDSSNRGGTVAANTLFAPMGIWSDGTRLFVADARNNRVLIWSTFPTTNGQAADLVLGQPDLTSDTAAGGASGLWWPTDVTSDGTKLFVADARNNRVLIWDTVPVASATPADHVLGQGDFSHVTRNDDDQDNMPDATPSARTFNTGEASGFMSTVRVGTRLIVSDFYNARVLIFDGE